MGGVVPPETSVVRPIFAGRQGADDRGRALFAGFCYKLLQIPAERVDDIRFAGPHDILGFRTDAFAAGGAVVVRAKLHHHEITLLDLWSQALPEKSVVKTAAACAAKRTIDHVEFLQIEKCRKRRAPAPLVQVGTVG